MNLVRTRTKMVALGAGAAVTLGGAAFAASSAYAASTTPPTATSSAKPGAPATSAKHQHKQQHRGLHLGKRVAHADITLQTKQGFVERRIQHGTVTALTGSTLTVKSADGYVSSYALGTKHPDAAVKVGADVRVIGAVKVSTVTLDRVVTTAQMKQRAEQRKAERNKAGQGAQSKNSAPSSSTT